MTPPVIGFANTMWLHNALLHLGGLHMHIAVLADNIADRKQTERLLDRANSALASEIGTLYVDSFGDESSFLPVCMKYDLFLLDIDHDMAHCMEIVARLQELSAPGMIVVCKDAAEPYRRENAVQHLYTLDKPILTAPLHKLLCDIQQEIKSQKQNLTMIEIRDIEHTHFVSKDDIIYARCFEKEHRVHYVFDHHDAIDIIGNMDDIYRCLGNHAEFQVFGKDYVINQNHVRSQTKKSIQLSNGETLTCSSLQNLPLLGKLLFS